MFSKKIKESDIIDYILDNIDLLTRKNHTLGGWFDTDTKQIYLDVASVLPDKTKAVKLGKKYNQKAIYNLYDFEEIPTGGTGEVLGNLGEILDRAKYIESL